MTQREHELPRPPPQPIPPQPIPPQPEVPELDDEDENGDDEDNEDPGWQIDERYRPRIGTPRPPADRTPAHSFAVRPETP
jgi:hypothetical protein